MIKYDTDSRAVKRREKVLAHTAQQWNRQVNETENQQGSSTKSKQYIAQSNWYGFWQPAKSCFAQMQMYFVHG